MASKDFHIVAETGIHARPATCQQNKTKYCAKIWNGVFRPQYIVVCKGCVFPKKRIGIGF